MARLVARGVAGDMVGLVIDRQCHVTRVVANIEPMLILEHNHVRKGPAAAVHLLLAVRTSRQTRGWAQ